MLVRDALAAFVAGFNRATPDAPIIWVHLGWLRVPVIFFLDLLALIVGLLWRPRDVLRWWKQYAGWRTLYRRPDLKAMLDWELAELRAFASQRSCQ